MPNNHKIYTKWPQNIPTGHKVYQHFPLQVPPKFSQIRILGSKICHLATLFSRRKWIRLKRRRTTAASCSRRGTELQVYVKYFFNRHQYGTDVITIKKFAKKLAKKEITTLVQNMML
jgi:hypothetical protein